MAGGRELFQVLPEPAPSRGAPKPGRPCRAGGGRNKQGGSSPRTPGAPTPPAEPPRSRGEQRGTQPIAKTRSCLTQSQATREGHQGSEGRLRRALGTCFKSPQSISGDNEGKDTWPRSHLAALARRSAWGHGPLPEACDRLGWGWRKEEKPSGFLDEGPNGQSSKC